MMSAAHSASILWRRLDVPGHDACRLVRDGEGWRLHGAATFRERGEVVALAYDVACDGLWIARSARVRGFRGSEPVDLLLQRVSSGRRFAAGGHGERSSAAPADDVAWLLDGQPQPAVDGCLDLDLGFTPATNLLHLRRLALRPGEGADAPAAWLEPGAAALALLHQRYERRGASAVWYEAPGTGYAALLEVGADGFVRRYPGLWEAEP